MIPRVSRASLLLLAAFASACTIVRVDSETGPARIESQGLVEGHAAFGIPAEEHLLHLDLFDGSSSGAVAELVVWKLLRLEAGIAGAAIGLGPFHLGLGVLAYEPRLPEMQAMGRRRASEEDVEEAPAKEVPDAVEASALRAD